MSELSPTARRLAKTAREDALDPADKARLRAALAAKIAFVPPKAPPSPPAASPTTGLLTGKAILAGTTIGVVAFVGGFFAGRNSVAVPALPPPAPIATSAPSAPPPPMPLTMEEPPKPAASSATPREEPTILAARPDSTISNALPAPLTSAPPKTSPVSAPRPVRHPDPIEEEAPIEVAPAPSASAAIDRVANSEPPAAHNSTLSAEMALLREAEAAMNGGDPSRALARLDDLGARYPRGQLREERLAARVFALCAAGRAKEARAEAEQLLREVPGSMHAARIRASCAFNEKRE